MKKTVIYIWFVVILLTRFQANCESYLPMVSIDPYSYHAETFGLKKYDKVQYEALSETSHFIFCLYAQQLIYPGEERAEFVSLLEQYDIGYISYHISDEVIQIIFSPNIILIVYNDPIDRAEVVYKHHGFNIRVFSDIKYSYMNFWRGGASYDEQVGYYINFEPDTAEISISQLKIMLEDEP